MTKIKMKATQYQSVPQGNERQYVDAEGEFYVFSEQEALARVERRLAERITAEGEGENGEDTQDSQKTGQENLASKPWTMQVTPEQYLERWPKGEHAEHAKALTAGQEGGEKSASTSTPASVLTRDTTKP